jgi:hypothetical protein
MSERPGANLFRASALRAVDTLDGLDEVMTIVPARSWIALSALSVALLAGILWAIFGRVPVVVRGTGVIAGSGGTRPVVVLSDGYLVDSPLPIGATVRRGDVIARVRTSAMETSPLRAPVAGVVIDVAFGAGAAVKPGDTIVTLEPLGATPVVDAFVGFRSDRPVLPGMTARVTPIDVSGTPGRALRGLVLSSAPAPASDQRMRTVLGSESLAAAVANQSTREVTIALQHYAAGRLPAGAPCSVVVTVDQVSPLAFVLPRDR